MKQNRSSLIFAIGQKRTLTGRLKTLKEGLSYFFDSLVLAHCHVVMRS